MDETVVQHPLDFEITAGLVVNALYDGVDRECSWEQYGKQCAPVSYFMS